MTGDELTRRIKPETHGRDGGSDVLVLGGGHVGHRVATSLESDGRTTLVDDSDVVCGRAAEDLQAVHGDPADADVLARVDADQFDAAIVAIPGDTRAFLATQLLRTRFDVEPIVARADDPELADVIGEQADAVVATPPILAPEFVSALERVRVPTARW